MAAPTPFLAARGLAAERAYGPPRPEAEDLLLLAGNEGPPPPADWLATREASPPGRYPDCAALEAQLARRLGIEPDRVLVTAGADDALLRCSLAALEPGRSALLTTPTFEMIPRYAQLAGGELRPVPWRSGPFPTEALLARRDASTAIAFLVSPNNPTGAVACARDLCALSEALPLVVLDAAYEEFADDPLTPVALERPNVLVTRTLSKAWGLAGLRVGYALGDPALLATLRQAGNPYPVSSASLELAAAWLAEGGETMSTGVARVRYERDALAARLNGDGLETHPSQANFVLVRTPRAAALHAALAERGVWVRKFVGSPELADALRVTCPADNGRFARLLQALDGALGEVLR